MPEDRKPVATLPYLQDAVIRDNAAAYHGATLPACFARVKGAARNPSRGCQPTEEGVAFQTSRMEPANKLLAINDTEGVPFPKVC